MIDRRSFISAATVTTGVVLAGVPALAHPAEEILLWPGTPPGKGNVEGPEEIGGEGSGYGAVSNISTPRMRVYRPNHPNGKAVLVCGGGGYFRIQHGVKCLGLRGACQAYIGSPPTAESDLVEEAA